MEENTEKMPFMNKIPRKRHFWILDWLKLEDYATRTPCPGVQIFLPIDYLKLIF